MAQTDHTHITTVTLSSTATNITFSNFSGYTDLLIIGTVWNNGNSNNTRTMYFQIYNSSGWNQSYYNSVYFNGNPTSVTGGSHSNNNGSGSIIGACNDYRTAWGTNNTAGWGPCMIGIGNYADSNMTPNIWFQSGAIGYTKNTSTTGRYATYGAGSVGTGTSSRTSAITQCRINASSGSFMTGTSFSMYGINYS